MNHDDNPMWDDPTESPQVRQLLRAGRRANSDYDAERGLGQHLVHLHAGAALPDWAEGLVVAKTSGSSLLTWLAPPLLAAALLGGFWVMQHSGSPQPRLTSTAAATNPMQAIAATQPVTPHSEPAFGDQLLAARAASQLEAEQARAAEHSVRPVRATISPPALAALSNLPTSAAPQIGQPAAQHGHGRHGSARLGQDEDVRLASAEVRASGNANNAALAAPSTTIAASISSTAAARTAANSGAVAANPAPGSAPSAHEVPSAAPAVVEEIAHGAVKAAPAKVLPVAAESDAPSVDSRLEREMQMLAVAQRVLADDPDRALHLAREGEREFHGSMFSAERKQVAILALVQLGRLDEARRQGAPFLRAYPNAPWSERLRQALSSGRLPRP
jgi:hypothetical protein